MEGGRERERERGGGQPQTDSGSLVRRNTEKYEVCDQKLEMALDIVDVCALPSVTFGAADIGFDCRSD